MNEHLFRIPDATESHRERLMRLLGCAHAAGAANVNIDLGETGLLTFRFDGRGMVMEDYDDLTTAIVRLSDEQAATTATSTSPFGPMLLAGMRGPDDASVRSGTFYVAIDGDGRLLTASDSKSRHSATVVCMHGWGLDAADTEAILRGLVAGYGPAVHINSMRMPAPDSLLTRGDRFSRCPVGMLYARGLDAPFAIDSGPALLFPRTKLYHPNGLPFTEVNYPEGEGVPHGGHNVLHLSAQIQYNGFKAVTALVKFYMDNTRLALRASWRARLEELRDNSMLPEEFVTRTYDIARAYDILDVYDVVSAIPPKALSVASEYPTFGPGGEGRPSRTHDVVPAGMVAYEGPGIHRGSNAARNVLVVEEAGDVWRKAMYAYLHGATVLRPGGVSPGHWIHREGKHLTAEDVTTDISDPRVVDFVILGSDIVIPVVICDYYVLHGPLGAASSRTDAWYGRLTDGDSEEMVIVFPKKCNLARARLALTQILVLGQDGVDMALDSLRRIRYIASLNHARLYESVHSHLSGDHDPSGTVKMLLEAAGLDDFPNLTERTVVVYFRGDDSGHIVPEIDLVS